MVVVSVAVWSGVFFRRVGFFALLCPYLERVRITRELKDVTVMSGEDAVFCCEVSQTAITCAEWWLGSNHLQNNDLNQISYHGREHSLVLKMVTPDDSGDVAFAVGCEKSVACLVVQEKPKGKGSTDAFQCSPQTTCFAWFGHSLIFDRYWTVDFRVKVKIVPQYTFKFLDTQVLRAGSG